MDFFSRGLTDTQQRYSAYDRELLAAYASVKHFAHLLEGRQFTLFTDHKPLTFVFKQKLQKASPRQIRHLDLLGQYTTDIQHIKGLDNVVADTLSRTEMIELLPSDLEDIAEKQVNDPELKKLIQGNGSLKFEDIPIPGSNTTIKCDVSTSKQRPYVPTDLRKTVFLKLHSMAHPRVRATVKLLRSRYIWKSINRDIYNWTRHIDFP